MYLLYFFDVMGHQPSNKVFLLELIKRRSEVYKKNTCRERPLILTNEKHFPETKGQ